MDNPTADEVSASAHALLFRNVFAPEVLSQHAIDDSSRRKILRMLRGDRADEVTATLLIASLQLGLVTRIEDEQVIVPRRILIADGSSEQVDETQNSGEQSFSDFRTAARALVASVGYDELQGYVNEKPVARSWLCGWAGAACAAALLDALPGDEIPICIAFIEVCSASA